MSQSTLVRMAGYRKLVAFVILLGFFGWLAWVGGHDIPLLGTLAGYAVTAFGILTTGHVVQAATAKDAPSAPTSTTPTG